MSVKLMALVAALALVIAACGGDDAPADPDPEPDAPEAAEEPEDADEAPEPDGDLPESIGVEELNELLGPVPEPSQEYRIAAVLKTLINEYWQQMEDGYLAAGEEYGVEVVVQAAEDEADLSGQLAIAETLVSQGFDAYGFSPLSGSNLDPAIQAVLDSGAPLVNPSDARIDNADVFIGADHRDMGVLAAHTIAEMLPDGGKVAQIEGQAGSEAARARIDGFDATIAEYSQFEYVASVPGDWDRQMALDAAENLLEAHPDIVAFYANNDTMALGVVEAVRNAGKLGEIVIIGTDGIPDAMRSIDAGELTGTVLASSFDEGWMAVEIAIRLLEGQQVPPWVVLNQTMVTTDNVADFL